MCRRQRIESSPSDSEGEITSSMSSNINTDAFHPRYIPEGIPGSYVVLRKCEIRWLILPSAPYGGGFGYAGGLDDDDSDEGEEITASRKEY